MFPDQLRSLQDNNVLINSNNTNIVPKSTFIYNHDVGSTEEYQKRVSKSISDLRAYLLLSMLLSMIGYGLLIGLYYKNKKSIDQLETFDDQSANSLRKMNAQMKFLQDTVSNSKFTPLTQHDTLRFL